MKGRCLSNPDRGFSIHHASGSKYAIISNTRWTMRSASLKLRGAVVFATLYSLHGTLAAMSAKYFVGYLQ